MKSPVSLPTPSGRSRFRSRRRLGATALFAMLLAVGTGVGLRYAGVLAAGGGLRNGGMEEGFSGGLAVGWENNSWGDAVVSFSADSDLPHTGRTSQRIRCERVTQGAAQIRQPGIAVRAGQPYTLTLWLRGTVETPITLGLRQNDAPYQRYLIQNVRVTPEWRRYVVAGVADGEDPNAGLYLAFKSPGDLSIDDVELREGVPDAAPAHVANAAPERKGNLLYNSGFELGADGWGPVSRLRVETTGAPQGHVVARATSGYQPILLESRPVVIRPGGRYTASASLKAAGPAEVEMVLLEFADEGGDRPGQRDAIRQTFRIGRQWQRVSLSGILNAPFTTGYVLQLNLRSGDGPVWADAVQWEEGDLTPYQPAAPVEVAVRAKSRLLSPGEAAITDCPIARASTAPASFVITYRLEDADGRTVAERPIRYGAVAGTHPSKAKRKPSAAAPPIQNPKSKIQNPQRLSWKLPRPGIYRVVAVPPGTPVGRTGQAVVCQFAGGAHPATTPRIGIHGWSDPASPNSALQAAGYLGAGSFRLHDFRSFVQWYEVEPSAGQYVWHDRDVADLSHRGYQMLGTLCRTPTWAARAAGDPARHPDWSSAPPRDWAAWDRYLQAVVGRYHGQIGAWEVWNEPWGQNFWSGTPEEYRELLARAHRVIKAADAKALVIGGCFSPEFPRFTRAVLAAGGLDAMDVVSYHDYLSPAKVAEPAGGGEPLFYRSAAALRDEIRDRGGRQPVWCTETGIACPSFYSWLPKQGPRFSDRVAVGALVKGVTLLLAADVERVYYYHMGGLEWGHGYPSRMLNAAYTLLDYDGAPKATLPALAQATAMLGDAGEPADLSTPALRAYAFHRAHAAAASAYVAVVWARNSDSARSFSLPPHSPVTLLDAMGARLTTPTGLDDRPIYLLARTRTALEQAITAAS